jgi:hypothetical protein
LANGSSGAIEILDGANLVARVVYGPFNFSVGGQSIQLKVLTMDAAQQKVNWCVSQNAWAQLTDKGTPGAASDCP